MMYARQQHRNDSPTDPSIGRRRYQQVPKQASRSQPSNKCYTCGCEGHASKDCWELIRNSEFRPSDWESKLTDDQQQELLATGSVRANAPYSGRPKPVQKGLPRSNDSRPPTVDSTHQKSPRAPTPDKKNMNPILGHRQEPDSRREMNCRRAPDCKSSPEDGRVPVVTASGLVLESIGTCRRSKTVIGDSVAPKVDELQDSKVGLSEENAPEKAIVDVADKDSTVVASKVSEASESAAALPPLLELLEERLRRHEELQLLDLLEQRMVHDCATSL